MKFNLRAVLGTAIVAVAMLATGCGSLANNAAGLDRNADGVARESRHERRVERESNRGYRHVERRHDGGHNFGRRGVNRHTVAQNHYLKQDDLTLRNGRFLGDGVNPATGMHERNVYNTPRPNHGEMVRDLAYRNYDNDVVGTDGVVRREGNNVRNRQYNNTPRTARQTTRNTALTS